MTCLVLVSWACLRWANLVRRRWRVFPSDPLAIRSVGKIAGGDLFSFLWPLITYTKTDLIDNEDDYFSNFFDHFHWQSTKEAKMALFLRVWISPGRRSLTTCPNWVRTTSASVTSSSPPEPTLTSSVSASKTTMLTERRRWLQRQTTTWSIRVKRLVSR